MKFSRRELIRMSAGACLAPVATKWGALQAADAPLILTTIPSTGQQVPSVGIGTVDFGGDVSSSAIEPLGQILELFHSLGGRVIDTSPNYGNSEEVLGTLLTRLNLRDQVFMATKVDREDPAEGIERMESSFRQLGGNFYSNVFSSIGEILGFFVVR